MSYLSAVLLGLLQGATEFLPISSSGHLVLAEHFFNVEEAGLSFDVAMHLGSLLAVLVYFRNDFKMMAMSLFAAGDHAASGRFHRRLFWYITAATLPAVAAGLLFGDRVEAWLRGPLPVAGALAGIGLVLLLSERQGRRLRRLEEMTLIDALQIGCWQALAIVPGVSRSGITMATGLFRDLKRPAAARFSFLLSTPVILGAGVYKLPAILAQGAEPGQAGFFLTGFVAAAVSGYLFIVLLLRFVQRHSLAVFAYYRFLLAGLVTLVLL